MYYYDTRYSTGSTLEIYSKMYFTVLLFLLPSYGTVVPVFKVLGSTEVAQFIFMKRVGDEIDESSKRVARDTHALPTTEEQLVSDTACGSLETRRGARSLQDELREGWKRAEEERRRASSAAYEAERAALREKQRCTELEMQRDFLLQSEKSLLCQVYSEISCC